MALNEAAYQHETPASEQSPKPPPDNRSYL